MLGAFESGASRKNLVQHSHNWDVLSREDIYRQRLLGNKSGMENFIEVANKRKMTGTSLIVYLIYMVISLWFAQRHIENPKKAGVNNAIGTAILRAPFKASPTVRTFNDISTMTDLKKWLLNAFPPLTSPDEQTFNIPVKNGLIVFSVERVEAGEASARFKDLNSLVWKEEGGQPVLDTTPFGCYRQWTGSQIAQFKMRFTAEPSKKCPLNATLIDTLKLRAGEEDTMQATCETWCGLLVDPVCRCFTISTSRPICNFFSIPIDQMQKRGETNTMLPKLEVSADNQALFPAMAQFATEKGKSSFDIEDLRVLPALDEAGLENIIDRDMPLRSRTWVTAVTVQEYILGEMLSWGTKQLTVKYITFNPNYEMFTLVKLIFKVDSSGLVSPKYETLSVFKSQTGSKATPVTPAEYVYIIGTAIHILIELYVILFQGFVSYFKNLSNIVTLVMLILQATSITLWLINRNQDVSVEKLTLVDEFEAVYNSHYQFSTVVAYSGFLVWINLIRFFNDLVPRIHVVMDAAWRALVPSLFVVVIVMALVLVWMVFGMTYFGPHLDHFSTVLNALSNVVMMQFVKTDALNDILAKFDWTGLIYALTLSIFNLSILHNLVKAIVLTSFKDASVAHNKRDLEDQQGAVESENSADPLHICLKRARTKIRRFLDFTPGENWLREPGELKTEADVNIRTTFKFTVIYIIFVAIHLVMVVLVIATPSGSNIAHSIRSAITQAHFTTVLPVTNEINEFNTFETMSTSKDVSEWFRKALPKTLFETSTGQVQGKDNPLFVYESSPQYSQLVINDWNILVGQEPVRLSLQYAKMKDLEDTKYLDITTKRINDQLVFVSPFGSEQLNAQVVSDLDAIELSTTQEALRDCNWRAVPQVFTCMLSVNKTKTLQALEDFYDKDLIATHQLRQLFIDFVVYNGGASSFIFVSLMIGFQPDGSILKDISVTPIDLYSFRVPANVIRFICEIIVMVMTTIYFFAALRDIKVAVLDQWKLSVVLPNLKNYRVLISWTYGLFRDMTTFVLRNPFCVLDILSSVITFLFLFSWWAQRGSLLRQSYVFPENARWTEMEAKTYGWTWFNDEQLIDKFQEMARHMNLLTIICGVDSALIFMRIMKYLKIFRRVNIIFLCFYHGFVDIVAFLLVAAIGFYAFVFWGINLFGAQLLDFQSVTFSALTCFDIFAGNADYYAMKRVAPTTAVVFVVLFTIVFKMFMINMFLAIIDFNFRRVEWAAIDNLPPMNDGAASGEDVADDDVTDAPITVNIHVAGEGKGEADDLVPTSIVPSDALLQVKGKSGNSSGIEAEGASDIQTIWKQAENVANWNSLPHTMQKWAVETASEVSEFVDGLSKEREQIIKKKGENSEHDSIMDKADTSIKAKNRQRHAEAMEVKTDLFRGHLKMLSIVHQDQESLSWYIMKREAEMKALERSKESKQLALDKMHNAVQSFIASEDQKPPSWYTEQRGADMSGPEQARESSEPTKESKQLALDKTHNAVQSFPAIEDAAGHQGSAAPSP
eukprot:TRINITY_DN12452_c0_g1_i10.p1 TRINITY_DN12452_c0_g1~~TRINITY_DN12452_c0_g1_i10.p1  ORF type:complete len:1511 (-),score=249.85 TRINITY_DN12452_c0_g1_i10:110-4642(-)